MKTKGNLNRVNFWSNVDGISQHFKKLSIYDKLNLAKLLDNQIAYSPNDTEENNDLKTLSTNIYGAKAADLFRKKASYGTSVLLAVCTAFEVLKKEGVYIYVPKGLSDEISLEPYETTHINLRNHGLLFGEEIDKIKEDGKVPLVALHTMFINSNGTVTTVGDIYGVDKKNKCLRNFT